MSRNPPKNTPVEIQPPKVFIKDAAFHSQLAANENSGISPLQINSFRENSGNFCFAAFSEQTVIKLLPFLERVLLISDSYLYQPGDAIEYLYFPIKAVLTDFQVLEDGRTVELAMIGKEGIPGSASFLSSSPAINWTQTAVAGSALKISADYVRREFDENREFQSIFFQYVNSYLHQISQRSICNTYHSVEERFCGWLIMLSKRCKSEKLQITHEQIARSLGVHRPTISCIAKNLRRGEIIDYRRGKLSILNLPRLAKNACLCHLQIDGHYPKLQES